MLGLLGGRCVSGVEARHPRQRGLFDPVDDVGHVDAAHVEDRRDDVGAVVVLVTHLATASKVMTKNPSTAATSVSVELAGLRSSTVTATSSFARDGSRRVGAETTPC
jgi:hypothetical protein